MKSPPKPPPENNPHNQTLKRPRGRPKGSRDRVPRQSRALEPEILRIIEALAERAAAADFARGRCVTNPVPKKSKKGVKRLI